MPWVVVGTIDYSSSGGGSGAMFTDAVAFEIGYGIAETLSTPSDAATFDIASSYGDQLALPLDMLEFAVIYADSVGTPTDSRGSVITRWASSNTTSGTAPTNPTNAQGEKNGTVATCKTGGVAAGTSGLVLTIATPMAEISSGSTRTFYAYYAFNAGTADTCAASVSYRQVGQGANTTITLPATGNFLTTPTSASLTNIDPTFPITASFLHSATVVATGGSVTVDAVGVETTGAL